MSLIGFIKNIKYIYTIFLLLLSVDKIVQANIATCKFGIILLHLFYVKSNSV